MYALENYKRKRVFRFSNLNSMAEQHFRYSSPSPWGHQGAIEGFANPLNYYYQRTGNEMVWPHPLGPPNRAFGVASNPLSRSGAREQESGEPQSNLREQGSAKSQAQADSQLELSEIAAQLASIQATVATIRDTQNQQGELLRISVQQIDDKITSLHSTSLTEIRAIAERLETSAWKKSVDV